MACIGACEILGINIDRIVHAEVMATKDIPADLPPMVEFKKKADEIIYKRWGLTVEHFSTGNYQDKFYRFNKHKQHIYGFPIVRGAWCNSELKIAAINKIKCEDRQDIVGIAFDETARIERAKSRGNLLPLVKLKWTEADAKQWCVDNDLLSPIYTGKCTRGGCWFCHNQGVEQLRNLRRDYPDLWQLLLKWDSDSPVTFRPDGHTVHDFDRRFQLEDKGYYKLDGKFRWNDLKYKQMNIFQYLEEG